MSGGAERESNALPVVIMGETYRIRAEEGAAYIKKLARFVDQEIDAIRKETGTTEPLKLAILAALNITDKFLKVEEARKQADAELAASADELVETLEASLREPTETSPAI